MKKALAVFLFLTFLGAAVGMAQHILTNKDVLEMVSAKLSDSIIIDEIHKSPSKFATAPDDLIALKKAGVSDAVIQAMTSAGNASPGIRIPAASAGGTAAPANASAAKVSVALPDGTPVEVELKATVSSEDLQDGSVIDFTVVHPVVVNGVTVIAQGYRRQRGLSRSRKLGIGAGPDKSHGQ